MGILAIVLLVCAVVLIAAAEWPRLTARIGDGRSQRRRKRRRAALTVIEGEGADDFAASVERDLANLPVLGEPEDRTRR